MNDNEFRNTILNGMASIFGIPPKDSWNSKDEEDLENTIMSMVTDIDDAMGMGQVNPYDLSNELNSKYGSNFNGF